MCMCGVVSSHVDITPDIIKAIATCLESRFKNLRLWPLRTLVGSLNVIATTTQLISSRLRTFLARNSIARFYKIIIKKSILSFIGVIQMSSISMNFFIPKFYIIAILVFRLGHVLKNMPKLRARIFSNVPHQIPPFFLAKYRVPFNFHKKLIHFLHYHSV